MKDLIDLKIKFCDKRQLRHNHGTELLSKNKQNHIKKLKLNKKKEEELFPLL